MPERRQKANRGIVVFSFDPCFARQITKKSFELWLLASNKIRNVTKNPHPETAKTKNCWGNLRSHCCCCYEKSTYLVNIKTDLVVSDTPKWNNPDRYPPTPHRIKRPISTPRGNHGVRSHFRYHIGLSANSNIERLGLLNAGRKSKNKSKHAPGAR